MKDYYYFLGVSRDDSQENIRKAYRKICFRCHPDVTDNDPFFQHRFRELKEAYDVLSDEERRRVYDHMLDRQQTMERSPLPANVKEFRTNKIRAQEGEEIILTWKTNYADLVKIHPFGLQKTYGEKIFKAENFDSEGKLHLILNATNTLLNQTVARRITITQIFTPEERLKQNDIAQQRPQTPSHGLPLWLWFMLILVLCLVLLGLIFYFWE